MPRPVTCRSVLFQPEEERSRPRGTGDLSRDRGQRAVPRALPGAAVIEDHDLVSPPLPFAHQPGAGLQLRAEADRTRSSLLQLLCNLAQLALLLWALLRIGRLAIGCARIKRMEIDELVVKKVRITDSLETPSTK